jgi:hypothetical protein
MTDDLLQDAFRKEGELKISYVLLWLEREMPEVKVAAISFSPPMTVSITLQLRDAERH